MRTKSFVIGGVVALAAICGWALAFVSGLFPYLGHASKSESFARGSSPSSGFDGGPRPFLSPAGETAFVDYRTTARGGSLRLYVRPFGLGDEAWDQATYDHIATGGAGRLAKTISATGIYVVGIEPTTAFGRGPGYDVADTAPWGADWHGPAGKFPACALGARDRKIFCYQAAPLLTSQ